MTAVDNTDKSLEEMYCNRPNWYCPYRRVHQKAMDRNEWLVDGMVHKGAHFPLCIFTRNADGRGEEAFNRRAAKKGRGKAETERGLRRSLGTER